MKSFWGSFFGTLVGVVVTTVFIFLIIIGIVVSSVSQMSAKKEKTIKVKHNSVLHVKFEDEIPERTSNDPFANFSFGGNFEKMPIGLNDILSNIEKAKEDKNIKGIYLDISSIPAGIATLEEIRNALLDFKTSKKFMVAYSEGYSQGSYYLATVADKIYLNPEGSVDFKGLSRQVMFYKNMLSKLEIEMQIFRHGKFKSATEPFFLDKMSRENREQTTTYISSIWNFILEGISKQRNISVAELNKYADNMLITDAESALQYKLVDQVLYKDEMLEILKELSGAKSAEKINYVEMNKYRHAPKASDVDTKTKIAVVYASGSIEGGEGDEETIGSEQISKAIREARLDSNVKAIVLRVNSPGGSALASDVIWREMALAKKVKPVVVSMGDVAASGGYYIACAADAIVAHPITITGSIGVFGVFPNMKNLFENKFGITVDTVNTNKHADIMSPYRPVRKEEGEVIQKWIEDVYADFISKVGKGRNMSVAEVDSIGQGRVWSGIDAKKIGLVDEFGGIKDAIAIAAKKAELKEYSILELPKQKDPFEEILNTIFDQEAMVQNGLKKEFGTSYENYQRLKSVMKYKGVQMRLPYDVVIY
ncbi:MAG: signal peptide peptidase SppA [Bacteroidetes bacterium]|nr:MAG: signal peptide peptidase SppA [Bacteroidota bacterium]